MKPLAPCPKATREAPGHVPHHPQLWSFSDFIGSFFGSSLSAAPGAGVTAGAFVPFCTDHCLGLSLSCPGLAFLSSLRGTGPWLEHGCGADRMVWVLPTTP